MAKRKPKTQNTWPVLWHARIMNPGDGSDDGILELPSELCDQLGCKVGDILEISVGMNKRISLKKILDALG